MLAMTKSEVIDKSGNYENSVVADFIPALQRIADLFTNADEIVENREKPLSKLTAVQFGRG